MSGQALCGQPTASGRPCRKRVMVGGDRCAFHTGPATGRPSLLTDELAERLASMLRAGSYVNVAVRAVGVSRSTLGEWLRRGRSGRPEDAPYAELRELLDTARAEGEVRNVATIARAAGSSWQAAAWLLERQYPHRWGRPPVRARDDEAAPASPEPSLTPADPFAEVDELAERRRQAQR